jgi:hypothetical protein
MTVSPSATLDQCVRQLHTIRDSVESDALVEGGFDHLQLPWVDPPAGSSALSFAGGASQTKHAAA